MDTFLKKIHALTEERVAAAKVRVSPAMLRDAPLFARKPRAVVPVFIGADSARSAVPLTPALSRPRSAGGEGEARIIAEIKFASPSEGEIRRGDNAAEIASSYLAAGAAMLSVLTEPRYFKGALSYLQAVRMAHPDALLLRKDFIVDGYQLLEARASGADAILLIVAMTAPDVTKKLFHEARALGLSVLVEVHDEAELDEALSLNADFIGVNNRNLKTLKTDLDTSRRLAARKPPGAAFICESGLKTAEDVRDMRAIGYDGFLMGTHFMRKPDPGAALKEILSCA